MLKWITKKAPSNLIFVIYNFSNIKNLQVLTISILFLQFFNTVFKSWLDKALIQLLSPHSW